MNISGGKDEAHDFFLFHDRRVMGSVMCWCEFKNATAVSSPEDRIQYFFSNFFWVLHSIQHFCLIFLEVSKIKTLNWRGSKYIHDTYYNHYHLHEDGLPLCNILDGEYAEANKPKRLLTLLLLHARIRWQDPIAKDISCFEYRPLKN